MGGCESVLVLPAILTPSPRRTGIVTNVTPHAVSVLVYKVVGNRYIAKRVNIRVEHVRSHFY